MTPDYNVDRDPAEDFTGGWCVVHGTLHVCEFSGPVAPITADDEHVLRTWVRWSLGPPTDVEAPEHPVHIRASAGLYASLLAEIDRLRAALPDSDSLGAAGQEYAVVWRWKTDRYRDEFSDERRKLYKTEVGARRLLDKLNKNGGKYEKHTETEPSRYDDGYHVEHWQIDYARIEARPVGSWSLWTSPLLAALPSKEAPE